MNSIRKVAIVTAAMVVFAALPTGHAEAYEWCRACEECVLPLIDTWEWCTDIEQGWAGCSDLGCLSRICTSGGGPCSIFEQAFLDDRDRALELNGPNIVEERLLFGIETIETAVVSAALPAPGYTVEDWVAMKTDLCQQTNLLAATDYIRGKLAEVGATVGINPPENP